MMQTAQDWARAWNEARLSSSLARGRIDPRGWEDFWNFCADCYARRNRQSRHIQDAIVGDLAAAGAVTACTSVLDVGCGPGTYTLPLAACCRRVTGLDTAVAMLSQLTAEAAQEAWADRIEILAGDWNTLPDEPGYDVVFAAKTPAIGNYASLMKMNRIARRTCCLIGFAGPYTLTLRSRLWQLLTGSPLQGGADITYPFNILYLEGYRPNLRFYSYRLSYRETTEYLIEHYTRYFSIFGHHAADTQGKIAVCLSEYAQDGCCCEEEEITLGVMWWNVNRKALYDWNESKGCVANDQK